MKKIFMNVRTVTKACLDLYIVTKKLIVAGICYIISDFIRKYFRK